ncbi:MAG: T9SS type A sorting domain-containing protein [Hymenobacteraceae bacterium]|nr:T9SS type A sorting domain-containing protein [Hymenobacteraceae bacterium]
MLIRRITLLLVVASLSFSNRPAVAQVTGYHADNYPALGQNLGDLNQDAEVMANVGSVGWQEVHRYGSVVTGLPVRPVVLPAGFDFRFNGQPVTAVRLTDQFLLSFDTLVAPPFYVDRTLPDAAQPNPFLWLGQETQCLISNASYASSRIMTKTFGAAPHRQIWIQWNNLPKERTVPLGIKPMYVSAVLEETTNRIFVVYQRHAWFSPRTRSGAGIQLTPTLACQADTMDVRPGRTYYLQDDVLPADNVTQVFEPGARRAYDAAVWASLVPTALPSAAGAPPTVLRAIVVNRGTRTLTGWRASCRLDAGAPQIVTGGAPLAPGDTATVRFPIAWDRARPGAHRLSVWTGTATAQPDGFTPNDSLVTTLHVASREVPRRVLQEMATSSTCRPCAVYEDSLRTYDRRHPGRSVERIAYPMDFPGTGDPYYLPEFRTRAAANMRSIRNVSMYGTVTAPTMIANGYFYVDATDRFTRPPMPPFDSLMTVLETPPTYMELTGNCHVSGDSIRGRLVVRPTRWLRGGAYTLRAVVTERSTRNNATTNGQTEFHNVAKKMLLNRLLTAALAPEDSLVVPYTHFFAPGHTVESFDSLEVVAFLQYSLPTGTLLPVEVVQAVRLRPAHLPPPLGPPIAASAALAWALAPNPAAGRAFVHLRLPTAQSVVVEVRNALGQLVLARPVAEVGAGSQSLPLNLVGAAPGLYIVRLTVGAVTHTQRLVVE